MPGPTYDTLPPSGLDRTNGLNGFPGTPQPANTIAQQIATPAPGGVQGDGSFFEEDPDSPEFDFGEQGTVRHSFECDPGTFQFLIPVLQRGQMQYDSFNDVSRILNTSAKWLKGNRVKVVTTAEGLNWGIPPDEFSMEPMEINPDLMKHPRWNNSYVGAGGSIQPGYDGNALTDIQKGTIRNQLAAQNLASAASLFAIILGSGQNTDPSVSLNNDPCGSAIFPTLAGQWTIQQSMAWEIISKYWRGEDSFYLPAIVVTYTTYYYEEEGAPPMNPGGYIEDPLSASPFVLPYYFWSLDGTPNSADSNNKLQSFAVGNVGNLYSGGVTYLRKADQERYERTWFKRTQTWVGAPTGASGYIYWDPDLYNPKPTVGATPPGKPPTDATANPPYTPQPFIGQVYPTYG